jgi:hypothetical protein
VEQSKEYRNNSSEFILKTKQCPYIQAKFMCTDECEGCVIQSLNSYNRSRVSMVVGKVAKVVKLVIKRILNKLLY